jgi:hypothetical protein
VRNVLTNIPADPIQLVDGPLEVLVAAAQPVGFGVLSIDQEIAVIRRSFRSLIEAKLANIDVIARATPALIHERLSTKRYQSVHFIGHGTFDEAAGEGKLIFETEVGRPYPLGEREAREIFCGRGLTMVFLNACETGRGGQAEFNKGIAQSFVQHGLPAVVANQYTVLDSSAMAFAQHFYWSLAQGMSLGQASREARIAVNYAQSGDPIDWAVPVLYARDPNATMCVPPPARSAAPATVARERTRRAMKSRSKRVAVWDVDDVFPELEQTLDKMNAAQDYVGYALVDMPAPLDMWRHAAESYVRAEHLAERLKSRPAELGVDLLVCATRHKLADSEYENLYGWWPKEKQPAIAILSVAGFELLQPSGPETDRVIANAMVAAMAGFFGDMNTHHGRSKCPLFFNEEREFKLLAGAQAFDARCRKTLLRKHRDLLLALERLLQLF